MAKKDILIVVKTYPEISRKYTETVCTAGILAESRSLVRLYPIRFRYLEGKQQFKKYQWIRATIYKATADPRPESYTIDPDSIELGDIIEPGNDWSERSTYILNEHNIYPSVEALRDAQVDKRTSLGLVKPKMLKRVLIEPRKEDEVAGATTKKDSVISQIDMFEEKKDLYILPIRISIEFSCSDPACGGHKMSILDWEFGQLYRRVRYDPNWEAKIKDKIHRDIFNENRDTHIILGNMAKYPKIFCALGFFYPPKRATAQMALFT